MFPAAMNGHEPAQVQADAIAPADVEPLAVVRFL